ncbi:MAG: hypothetical protein ACJ74Y_13410 [Bryobacteraceae bacterium]
MEKVVCVIQELDNLEKSPEAKNVDLTLYAIAGSTQAIPGFEDANGEALAPVLKQLRAIFPYTHYQMISTVLMRSAQNKFGTAEGVPRPLDCSGSISRAVRYKIACDSVGESSDTPSTIHIAKFNFSASVPYVSSPKNMPNTCQISASNVGITSDVDLREGQKLVVRTSNIPEGNTCLFLVLSARLVQ